MSSQIKNLKNRIIIISAMSQDRVIGTKEGMPWNIEEEYQQYLRFITDQTVIMGRRSFEIFGPDLTSKNNYVISRNLKDNIGYKVFTNLEEAIAKAKGLNQKIFIAGGASIYSQALSIADEMYLSIIKGEYQGIAYFPEFDYSKWEVIEQQDHPRFKFIHYQRIS